MQQCGKAVTPRLPVCAGELRGAPWKIVQQEGCVQHSLTHTLVVDYVSWFSELLLVKQRCLKPEIGIIASFSALINYF